MNVSGEYIKFEVYQNHANKKNIFNQVAIDAINFMGSPNPDLAKEMADRQSSFEVLLAFKYATSTAFELKKISKKSWTREHRSK